MQPISYESAGWRSEETATRCLEVWEEAWAFFLDPARRIMGYCGCYVGLEDSRAKAFSYNKRTMDRAMGPF
jgi:hypothetical protein